MKNEPITVDVVGITETGLDHAASTLIMALGKATEFERMLAPEDRAGFRQECLDVANVASFLNSLAGAFDHASENNRNISVLFQIDPAKTNVIPFPKQPEVPKEAPVEPPACFKPIKDTMPPDLRAELEKLIAYIERDGKPVA